MSLTSSFWKKLTWIKLCIICPYFSWRNFRLVVVPWCEVSEDLEEEMTLYLRSLCMYRNKEDNATVSAPPTTHMLKQRIKRYYRAKRQQLVTAASPEKRRRRRFQNRRNRLTMVRWISTCWQHTQWPNGFHIIYTVHSSQGTLWLLKKMKEQSVLKYA